MKMSFKTVLSVFLPVISVEAKNYWKIINSDKKETCIAETDN